MKIAGSALFLVAALISSAAVASASDPRPMIYVAAMCMNGSCRTYGRASSQGEAPFQSLAECQSFIVASSSGGKIGADGRITMMPGMYWECRGKHIDTWESAH